MFHSDIRSELILARYLNELFDEFIEKIKSGDSIEDKSDTIEKPVWEDKIEKLEKEVLKLAKKISDEQKKINKRLKLFIQINIGSEDQKSGISPKNVYDFANYCKELDLDNDTTIDANDFYEIINNGLV